MFWLLLTEWPIITLENKHRTNVSNAKNDHFSYILTTNFSRHEQIKYFHFFDSWAIPNKNMVFKPRTFSCVTGLCSLCFIKTSDVRVLLLPPKKNKTENYSVSMPSQRRFRIDEKVLKRHHRIYSILEWPWWRSDLEWSRVI